MEEQEENSVKMVGVKIASHSGQDLGHVVVPVTSTVDNLQALCNKLLGNVEPLPMSFRTAEGQEIHSSLKESIPVDQLTSEKAFQLIYHPQAVFRVRAVTRCTSSLPGHSEPIVSAQFSPDGRNLASGSGDHKVRLWDLQTELPFKTCSGHDNWVLCISWSPNGLKLASACKDGVICLWNPKTGEQMGKTLKGHKKWITSMAWNPLHQDPQSRLLASAGKDGTIRIWDTVQGTTIRTLAGHTASVTSICWGGCGLIYSGSQDRTVKVWRVDDGVVSRNFTKHAHWINTLALNVSYALRTGCFMPENDCKYPGEDQAQEVARRVYEKALDGGKEMLVSGSNDNTLFLWSPCDEKTTPIQMTGHQNLINHVQFSPDTKIIASASFDKSIKLWCGRTGKFLSTLRGHIAYVYQIAWSSDSSLLVSGSKDSTLKVWDVRKKKLMIDLPGHGDEVFTVDWSPDGERVVSGGKDKVLKLWRR